MKNQQAILFIEEFIKFIEGCNKEYLEKNPFLSENEYEAVRRYKNFMIAEIEISAELIRQNVKKENQLKLKS